MQLRAARKDTHTVHRLPLEDGRTIIGRRTKKFIPDIDLFPDLSVSRRHAQLWRENGGYWIEDLDSHTGTLLNAAEIKGTGKHPLSPDDLLEIGNTKLRLEADAEAVIPENAMVAALERIIDDEPRQAEIRFSAELLGDAAQLGTAGMEARLLGAIRAITKGLGNGDRPAQVARLAVRGLRELVPAAAHAAFLLLDEQASDMVLAAHEPEGEPHVSVTLANLAIQRKQALVWTRAPDGIPEKISQSADEQKLENVLCAPLLWQGQALGALWLCGAGAKPFSKEDLGLVVALAHHAALAIAFQRVRDEAGRHAMTFKRIMAHFSPKVATRLLEQARHGRLRPGGLESQVTLLRSDLRGFTAATAAMPADEIVDMLNEYFAELVAAILRHEGTVDKFIGDAILAVFGSPEADPDHHGNAVLAAQEMQQSMRRLNESRAARGQVVLELGIGVHCGKVLHGFIGSEGRVEFTVIGDAVNMTSRYCDAAGSGEIVISAELHQVVWKKVKARRTQIETKHEGNLPAFILQEK
jgi:adenylate cyclase